MTPADIASARQAQIAADQATRAAEKTARAARPTGGRRRQQIPGVRRGTSKRRAANLGQHVFQHNPADRAVYMALSQAGKRP